MTIKIRDDVRIFAEHMEAVLRKHDKEKDGWEGESLVCLFEKLQEEYNEAHVAKENLDPIQAFMELVDLSNICMMICSNLERKYPGLALGSGIQK